MLNVKTPENAIKEIIAKHCDDYFDSDLFMFHVGSPQCVRGNSKRYYYNITCREGQYVKNWANVHIH